MPVEDELFPYQWSLINQGQTFIREKDDIHNLPMEGVNGKDIDGRNDGYSYGCRIYQIDGRITPTPTKEYLQRKLREVM